MPCSLENIPQPQVRSLEQKPQVKAGYGAFIHSFIPVIRRSFQRHKASLNWTTLRLLLADAHVPALPAGVFWSQELAATLPHLLISPLSNSLHIFLFGLISSDVLRPSSAGTLLPLLFSRSLEHPSLLTRPSCVACPFHAPHIHPILPVAFPHPSLAPAVCPVYPRDEPSYFPRLLPHYVELLTESVL